MEVISPIGPRNNSHWNRATRVITVRRAKRNKPLKNGLLDSGSLNDLSTGAAIISMMSGNQNSDILGALKFFTPGKISNHNLKRGEWAPMAYERAKVAPKNQKMANRLLFGMKKQR